MINKLAKHLSYKGQVLGPWDITMVNSFPNKIFISISIIQRTFFYQLILFLHLSDVKIYNAVGIYPDRGYPHPAEFQLFKELFLPINFVFASFGWNLSSLCCSGRQSGTSSYILEQICHFNILLFFLNLSIFRHF